MPAKHQIPCPVATGHSPRVCALPSQLYHGRTEDVTLGGEHTMRHTGGVHRRVPLKPLSFD